MHIQTAERLAPEKTAPFVLKNGKAELSELPGECSHRLFKKILPLFLGRIDLLGAYVYVAQSSVSKLNAAAGVLPGIVLANYFLATFCFGKSGPSVALRFMRNPTLHAPASVLWSQSSITEAAAWTTRSHSDLFAWDGNVLSKQVFDPNQYGIGSPQTPKGLSLTNRALLAAYRKFGLRVFTRAGLYQQCRTEMPNVSPVISETIRRGAIGIIGRHRMRRVDLDSLQITQKGIKILRELGEDL